MAQPQLRPQPQPLTRRRLLATGAVAASALAVGKGIGTTAMAGAATERWPASARSAARARAIEDSALNDLRARLNGTVMAPGDSGFATASAPANGRYLSVQPAAVARVADHADVVTAIQWCNEHGVRLVGRGGGHSYAGLSTTTDLLLDLRRLNHVTIDRKAGTVRCGGAALNGDMFTATENGAYFLPGGTCLGVGTGGLALGGGIGYNAHWAGLTCDHMLASTIVTADGEALTIDDTTNNDLFWACRGGAGGNFGINTDFTFRLQEVPQQASFYRLEWTGADAAIAVLAAFDTMLAKAPTALNAVAMAEATPLGAGGAHEAISVMSRGAFIGPVDDLKDLIAPLVAIGKPTTNVLQPMAFWDIQRMIATEEPEPHSFGDISRYAKEPLPESAIAKMVDLLAECPSRSDDANGSIWSLGWVGGDVIGAYSRTETAYVHRDAHTLWRPTTVWPNAADPSVADGLNAWTDQVIDVLRPLTPDESYQNFPNRDIADWAEQYYAENLSRLIDVKTKYDPQNFFQNAQSIPTRG
ncbi:MAG: FAD-binding oxidoreductase [Thermomicrobiales bacterium]